MTQLQQAHSCEGIAANGLSPAGALHQRRKATRARIDLHRHLSAHQQPHTVVGVGNPPEAHHA